jgi:hypothetical protein
MLTIVIIPYHKYSSTIFDELPKTDGLTGSLLIGKVCPTTEGVRSLLANLPLSDDEQFLPQSSAKASQSGLWLPPESRLQTQPLKKMERLESIAQGRQHDAPLRSGPAPETREDLRAGLPPVLRMTTSRRRARRMNRLIGRWVALTMLLVSIIMALTSR